MGFGVASLALLTVLAVPALAAADAGQPGPSAPGLDAIAQGLLAAVAAVLVGVAYVLSRQIGKAGKGALRERERSLGRLARKACEACGTAWTELSFCLRCGAERAPANRYATPPRRAR